MPKQIKKKEIPKLEKQNRALAITEMVITFVFTGVLFAMLKDFMNEESLWRGCVIFGSFILFFLFALIHCFHGFYVFSKREHYGILFQSILSAAAAFTAFLNLQFAIVLFLSSIGKDSAVDKILGTRTMDDFIAAQAGSWKMLAFGMCAMIFIGVTSIISLANRD